MLMVFDIPSSGKNLARSEQEQNMVPKGRYRKDQARYEEKNQI